jgi:hypothetical protein
LTFSAFSDIFICSNNGRVDESEIAEASGLEPEVLGGAIPFTATNFWGHLYNGNTPDLQSGNRSSILRGSTKFMMTETNRRRLGKLLNEIKVSDSFRSARISCIIRRLVNRMVEGGKRPLSGSGH